MGGDPAPVFDPRCALCIGVRNRQPGAIQGRSAVMGWTFAGFFPRLCGMSLFFSLAARIHPPPSYDPDAWWRVVAGQGVLTTLPAQAQSRLWSLAFEFLRTRAITPVGGLELNEDQRLLLGFLAVLPVLELGLGWYRGLGEVVVYPTGFAPVQTWQDEYGVVHTERRALIGEAWEQGLLILSWEDVLASGPLDGHHVVLHECAHWLDMQAGTANGRPPLHPEMSAQAWSEAFTAAYAAFEAQPRRYPSLDLYAAQAPAEFFAVACESFFETPYALAHDFPLVYAQLTALLRQDPRTRIRAVHHPV